MPSYFESQFGTSSDDAILAERIADVLTARNQPFELKKMFGGLCFMVNGKMLVGSYKGAMMARVDPQEEPALTQRPGASPMMHGGRPMKGFLMVEPSGYESDSDLAFWVERCLEYNPKAKRS